MKEGKDMISWKNFDELKNYIEKNCQIDDAFKICKEWNKETKRNWMFWGCSDYLKMKIKAQNKKFLENAFD